MFFLWVLTTFLGFLLNFLPILGVNTQLRVSVLFFFSQRGCGN